MARVINFYAGPAGLPLPALERAQKELLDFEGTGMSVMEISHRAKEYDAVHNEAIALVRDGDLIDIDIPQRTINLKIAPDVLVARRQAEEKKGSRAYTPTDRSRKVSKALQAYALFAASADKGAVRILPEN